VLVADLRATILQALHAAGIPAVVAMSVPDKSPERLPHLTKAGLGSAHWIEAGVLTTLPYSRAQEKDKCSPKGFRVRVTIFLTRQALP
jgi:hypothetical protein